MYLGALIAPRVRQSLISAKQRSCERVRVLAFYEQLHILVCSANKAFIEYVIPSKFTAHSIFLALS